VVDPDLQTGGQGRGAAGAVRVGVGRGVTGEGSLEGAMPAPQKKNRFWISKMATLDAFWTHFFLQFSYSV